MKYDFLIVGAGPFGATFARTVTDLGKSCLVIDRRPHVAGNTFTQKIKDIDVHMYGPHLFHTNDQRIWNFVNQFGDWVQNRYSPRVRFGDRLFSFPINMLTLHQLWGVTTPAEARKKLDEVRVPNANPKNAEEWLLSQVGREIYETFFYGYSTKQWFKEPKDLPVSIVARVPIRLTYDDSYFRDQYQALPALGYTKVFENMLEGIDVELGIDFYDWKDSWKSRANRLVFAGPIDQFFDYEFGRLDYRSIRFERETLRGDFQGHAVINYPSVDVPFTRITEHKHFIPSGPKHIEKESDAWTVITRDFPIPPDSPEILSDPHYPIRDERNSERLEKYQALAQRSNDILFGGRLGEYRYYDMDQVIASALVKARRAVEQESPAT